MTCSRRSTTWFASFALAAVCTGPHLAARPAPPRDLGESCEAVIRQAITDAVKGRMGSEVDVRIEGLQLSARAGDGEGVLLAMPEPGARLARPIRFSLSRRVSGRTPAVNVGHAVATVVVVAPHVRASHAVPRGATCAADMLTTARAEVGGVLLQRLPSAVEIADAKAVRDIAPGEVITGALVAARPAVRSGDLVTVRAASDGVTVETQGVAEQSGGRGDTIRVVNRESRRPLKARVVGPGKVEVVQ